MADRIAVMADGRVQQVATPVELYRHPANRFVADFIGTSTMLAGRVDGDGFVADALGRLPRTPGIPGAVPAGPAHLVVRPEDVRLVPADPGVLQGVVTDLQFQGGTSRLAVAVPGLDRPFLVTVPGVAALARGTATGLDWDAAVVVMDDLA